MLSAVEASLSGMSARDGARSLEIPRLRSERSGMSVMLSAVEASLSGTSARDGTRSLEIPQPNTTPHHHRNTQPSPSTQPASQPVGAGFKPALPTKHHLPTTPSTTNQHPITAHHMNQRNQRFRLDTLTTSVVQIKTSAQPDTSRTRRPETSPRRTGLCAQLFSMPQLPTYKQGSADGSPHGEPEATAQAER